MTMTEVLAELVNRLPNVGSATGKGKAEGKAGKCAGVLIGAKRQQGQ
ncbi:hypothetical protein [Qipengyuania sediminis]|nr:hypothetical protein [Qipengyuania sediminis]